MRIPFLLLFVAFLLLFVGSAQSQDTTDWGIIQTNMSYDDWFNARVEYWEGVALSQLMDRLCRALPWPYKSQCLGDTLYSMIDWVITDGESLFGSFIEHFDTLTNDLLGISYEVSRTWQRAIVCYVERFNIRYVETCA